MDEQGRKRQRYNWGLDGLILPRGFFGVVCFRNIFGVLIRLKCLFYSVIIYSTIIMRVREVI